MVHADGVFKARAHAKRALAVGEKLAPLATGRNELFRGRYGGLGVLRHDGNGRQHAFVVVGCARILVGER